MNMAYVKEKVDMIYIVGIFLLLGLVPIAGIAMTIFSGKTEEVVLFSPFEGVITYNGEIIKNIEIIRMAKWGDNFEFSDKCLTNELGEFKFSVKKEKWESSRFAQFIVHQDVFVNYNNKSFTIWHMGKMNRGAYGELGGIPINFRCELTDDIEYVEGVVGLLGTSCKWDSVVREDNNDF